MHQTSVSAVKYESRSLNSDTHQMFMKKTGKKSSEWIKTNTKWERAKSSSTNQTHAAQHMSKSSFYNKRQFNLRKPKSKQTEVCLTF